MKVNGQHFKSHASRFVQRACFFIVCFCFGIKLGLACSLMFVALFDGVINIMLDRPIFHLGNTAKWDRFFRDQPGIFFFVKFSSTIGFILLFYYA
jgi:hypothetical protein